MNSDMLTWLLAAEILILALVFVGFFYFMSEKGKTKEREAVSVLLKKLKKKKNNRKDDNIEMAELPAFDEESLELLLDEIHKKETNLYQHVVKIFLQKEAAHLKSLDKHVNSLSEPYWDAIKNLATNEVGAIEKDGESSAKLQAALNIAVAEKERLSEQLSSALETLDDVSTEYTRMFSSSRDVDDLMESKEIMLELYGHALNNKATDKSDDIPVAYENMEQI